MNVPQCYVIRTLSVCLSWYTQNVRFFHHRDSEKAQEFHKYETFKTAVTLNYYVQISSPYRAVNTLRLGYKNQSVNPYPANVENRVSS
jgi:hypothetical protein